MLGGGGKVPGWAQIPEIGVEMNKVYKSGTVPEFPALIGDRALLLCPTIHENMVSCEYAIVNKGEPRQEVTVVNSATGEEYRIVIEQSDRFALNGDDARFKLIKPPDAAPSVPTGVPVTAGR